MVGNVEMGEKSSVWFGVTVRGDHNAPLIIGEDSNVQDGTVLHMDHEHPLTIGKGVTVGHMAMLHGCSIGDNTLIGIGATVLNRAVVGKNCIIGAHSLVTEGKAHVLYTVMFRRGIDYTLFMPGSLLTSSFPASEGKVIPDGSLVMGSPAKVVRQLSSEAIAANARSAQSYVENAARFRKGMHPM